ncbi:hypothetical protein KUCAC02_021438 [Chaenocephalus aceratus]|uniref:Uncharacterized protein n=1 Tax=Chaenocephalus aceratus TaxID=36190 RepID=A0ACB9XFF1_CHAAC|nr:hypothetical protein KUCAC02_021438 [Chaenocephalus aceratus]
MLGSQLYVFVLFLLGQYEKSLLDKCMELTNITERCLHTDDEFFLKSMREAIHEILTDVSDSFSNMIDMALANEIRLLIKQIDSSDSVHTIGSAISNLLSLTQDGPQLCSIIAKVLIDRLKSFCLR